ncbi:MAG: ammonium transporter [Candidatus Hydrogenedentes bacterium]|nr:ammonium transporter [Candidatus Hydrogenedentota bacterium]
MTFVALPALAQDPPADAAATDAAPADEVATEEAAAPAPAPELNSGDTAWMLTSMALVLFMTIPGLSLFYGGLVRSKNVLSILMQCFAITAAITVLWVIVGYSIAFDTTGSMNKYVGGFGKLFLKGVGVDSLTLTIPETVFIAFQSTFAIITPALIIGAFAERMKFSAVLLFCCLWSVFVYSPIAHMVWGGAGAWFFDMGALDFAGGTVVHINAGIAALVGALMVGKRRGYPTTPMMPHNMTMAVTGAGMLWVGWFGFNAGSAVAANGTAGMAMLVTHICAATAAFTWMVIEWIKHGKPSALGAITGAVAGLVAITPASGTAGPIGALAIGVIVSVVCFIAATSVKKALGYDDSLDAFGVHGVGGLVGAMLTGVFANPALGGTYAAYPGFGPQMTTQAITCAVTILYCGIVSAILYKVVDLIVGLRVDEAAETEGLDTTGHNEAGYNLT